MMTASPARVLRVLPDVVDPATADRWAGVRRVHWETWLDRACCAGLAPSGAAVPLGVAFLGSVR